MSGEKHTAGPVEMLCKEIGFPFDRRIEREDVFIAFVAGLVESIAWDRQCAADIAPYTGKAPSEASARVLEVAQAMVSHAPDLNRETRLTLAETIHDRSHEINPDDPGHKCDHVVDMLASCASAIRFGLETPCRSRHAAEAANHVWQHRYGVSRFDKMTGAWEKDWARSVLTSALIGLLPAAKAKSPQVEG